MRLRQDKKLWAAERPEATTAHHSRPHNRGSSRRMNLRQNTTLRMARRPEATTADHSRGHTTVRHPIEREFVAEHNDTWGRATRGDNSRQRKSIGDRICCKARRYGRPGDLEATTADHSRQRNRQTPHRRANLQQNATLWAAGQPEATTADHSRQDNRQTSRRVAPGRQEATTADHSRQHNRQTFRRVAPGRQEATTADHSRQHNHQTFIGELPDP